MSEKSQPEIDAGASHTLPIYYQENALGGHSLGTSGMGSSGRPHRDTARSVAIEQFLLDGHFNDLIGGGGGGGSGPGLANSLASTMAPGSENIRGPGSITENPSFFSTKMNDGADGQVADNLRRGSNVIEPDKKPMASAKALLPTPQLLFSQSVPGGTEGQQKSASAAAPRSSRPPPSVTVLLPEEVPASGTLSIRGIPVVSSPLEEDASSTGGSKKAKASPSSPPPLGAIGSAEADGKKSGPRRTKSVGDILALMNGTSAGHPGQGQLPSRPVSPTSGRVISSIGSFRTPNAFSKAGQRKNAHNFGHAGLEAGARVNRPNWLSAAERLQRDHALGISERRFDSFYYPDSNRSAWQWKPQTGRLRAADVKALGQSVSPEQGYTASPQSVNILLSPNGNRTTDRGSESPVTPRTGNNPSNWGTMSEQFSGRHVHVRARKSERQGSTKKVSSGASCAQSTRPHEIKSGTGGVASLGSTTSKSSKVENHAENMFMSLFSGAKHEKPQHPSLFANDFALPSLVLDPSVPKKGSPQLSRGSGGAGGGGAGGGGAGGGGGGGDGGGAGGGGGGGDNNRKEKKVGQLIQGDEEEHEERRFKEQNSTALHAIPWDQRAFIPISGFGTKAFSIFSAPLFWEKLDWTVRASLFTVLPTMILTLEPKTEGIFPLPSSVAFLAFWITMPTFGSGLREFIIALKGYALSLAMLMIVILIGPRSSWLILLLLFLLVLITSFFAEQVKKTAAYCLAVFLMQLQSNPDGTGTKFVGDYFTTLLIALAFGLAAFFIPNIRWSSDLSKTYVSILGNSLSIYVQGTCSSFWTHSPLERELHILRLRQLSATASKAISKAALFFEEAGYEPHSGSFMSAISVRHEFLVNIYHILCSMVQVVELINENPQRIETPLCISFGNAIVEDLAIISSAMDSMILKISDFKHPVQEEDIQMFREARERFQDRLSEVRQDVILDNEMYETDESDVLLGFFMFSVDELCEEISNFSTKKSVNSNFVEWLKAPINDCKSSYNALRLLIATLIHRRSLTRRAKEAIKLALCMTVPSIFQVYALHNSDTSPVAGASIIAFVYSQTGAQSFTYAVNRVLGTVLGSLTAFLGVQIADSRRIILYIAVTILSFVGAYIQTSPEYFAAGNAICNSVISVITQYRNPTAAIVRIQQNMFAILMYFCISMVLWPMRARLKVQMAFDVSLRCFREATCRLLRNLDLPEDVCEVNTAVTDVLNEWNKKIDRQENFLHGASTEPTLVGAGFPENSWMKLIEAQRSLWSIMAMMRFAYFTFMSSKADDVTELSVHWVVLRRISPHAKDLSDLVYATVDLYLLSIGKTTVVPTSHLTRLRHGILEAEQNISEVYIQTICRKLGGDVSDEEDEEDDGKGSTMSKMNVSSNSGSSNGGGKRGQTVNGRGAMEPGGGKGDLGGAMPTTHSADPPPQENQKKKKGGYLMYNLTKEEEEELKRYLANRSMANRQKGGVDENAEDAAKRDRKITLRDSFVNNRSFLGLFNRTIRPGEREMMSNSSEDEAERLKKKGKKHRHGELEGSIFELDAEISTPKRKGSSVKRRSRQDNSNAEEGTTDGDSQIELREKNLGSLKGKKPDEDGDEKLKLPVVHPDSSGLLQTKIAKIQENGSFSAVEPTPYSGDCTSTDPSQHTSQLLQNLTFFNSKRKEFVLSNQDIHSLEAFLFGVRALTVQLGELQKALLEMQHAEELAKKV
ncbi:hypothetical protein MOQ_005692 [Trypanosoma cruzi marinkellei]|uniref:Integral membrane bound transporter domain-containing protein n=1 Tax=Trypanosoma cruzi marinkellei TaxID=85056 RepID=K2NNR9_TRYCR|nr:hypothetical protein MOQ_005692 [Trypanosoma cruzi marinkellei]